MENFELTKSQAAALDEMEGGGNFFLTGEAGTGKSFLIRRYIEKMKEARKNIVCCASSGVAAQIVGGKTCHSLFHIPFNNPPSIDSLKKYKKIPVPELVDAADIIVIDEISMLRFDAFEYCMAVVKHSEKRKRKDKTVVLVGDFYQIPPVIQKNRPSRHADTSTEKAISDEKSIAALWNLRPDSEGRYPFGSGFAFFAPAWKERNFKTITLKEKLRQTDEDFSLALDKIREGDADGSGIAFINENCAKKEFEDTVWLFSRNAQVEQTNEEKLNKLKGKAFRFDAEEWFEDGERREDHCTKDGGYKACLALQSVTLKEGARVMALVNCDDEDGTYSNGSLGTITKINEEDVEVRFDGGEKAIVKPYTWDIKSPMVVRKSSARAAFERAQAGLKIEYKTLCRITQIPLKLAYAVTMHKAQGQTFEKLNLSPSAFADGMLYVALSRAKTVKNIYLTRKIFPKDVFFDSDVKKFYEGSFVSSLWSDWQSANSDQHVLFDDFESF